MWYVHSYEIVYLLWFITTFYESLRYEIGYVYKPTMTIGICLGCLWCVSIIILLFKRSVHLWIKYLGFMQSCNLASQGKCRHTLQFFQCQWNFQHHEYIWNSLWSGDVIWNITNFCTVCKNDPYFPYINIWFLHCFVVDYAPGCGPRLLFI